MKIILLFDLSVKIEPKDYHLYWNTPDWKTENDIRKTLSDLGHDVIPFGIHNDLEGLLKLVRETEPDLVFNMSEAFSGNRKHEPHVTALLELMGVPFTGAGPMSLQLCKDKGLTKVILDYHGILTPKFVVAKRSKPLPSLKAFQFPAFVKPLELESSEGISRQSYVENEKDAIARIEFIHEKYGVDAIVEEFIDGREVYVGILGNEKLSVFPARELFFKQLPEDEPRIATYRVKWDAAYRKKWGIDSGWAVPQSQNEEKRLHEICKKIYRLLQIQGFGRIDLRIKDNGDIYFIEANPNPSIAKREDYALSAKKAGLEYSDLIAKIVSLSLKEAA